MKNIIVISILLFLPSINFSQHKEEVLSKAFSSSFAEVHADTDVRNMFKDSIDIFVTDWKEGMYYNYYNRPYTECIEIIFSRIYEILEDETLVVSTNKDGNWGKIDENDVTVTLTVYENQDEWDHRVIFYFWNDKIIGVKVDLEGI